MGDMPLDAKVMKKTQDTLGKIIKKPPLTEKLLSKPPFKFLHDIMTSVIKTTGFMEGLFTEAELDSENVKDKETKVAFLQKVIDMVSLVTGRPIAAKPSKIVAGHEPERTNELLQALAESINKKVKNADYVKQVLTTDDSKSSKKVRDSSKSKDDGSRDRRDESSEKDREKDKGRSETHKSSDKERSRDRSKENQNQNIERDSRHKDREERHKSKEEGGHGDSGRSKDKHRSSRSSGDKDRDDSRHRDDGKDERRSKHRDGEERKERTRDKESSSKHRSKDREEDRDRTRDKESSSKHRSKDREEDKEKEQRKDKNKESRDRSRDEDEKSKKKQEQDATSSEIGQNLPRPSSAKGQRKRHGKDDSKEDRNNEESKLSGSRKAPARPSSARPAPPKPKQRNDAPSDEVAVSSGLRRPNVIIDKDSDSDDNDFVTQEEAILPPPSDLGSLPRDKIGENEEGDGDHGGLVKKILETKKDYESTAQPARKTEIDRTQAITDASRRKERELIQKDIDRLRASIQTLTRSVNPLGKILDFLQEDLDSMQKELEMYQNENKENAIVLQREQSLTDTALLPLKSQLQELESSISDQVDLIAAAKATIGYNDVKISKILSSLAAKS